MLTEDKVWSTSRVNLPDMDPLRTTVRDTVRDIAGSNLVLKKAYPQAFSGFSQ